MAFKERVFSGMQPTGSLHLGNYLGAMVNWIEMQKTHECIYCVVDLHAITVWQDPKELKNAIRQVTAAYIASGLDPKKSILFNQSQVPEHAELAWVFNCVARLGWLSRMTQFKEKAGKDRENASVGLYAYPNLMAADILAYRATHVPVGEDQKQHLELARDIAQKFNNDFRVGIVEKGYADGIFFPPPDPVITGPATRVMSLRDGTKKMSKSEPSDMSRINLMDDSDTIADKIKRAKTDMEPAPPCSLEELKARPEIDNLVGIYAALAGISKLEALDVLISTSKEGPSIYTGLKRALTEIAVGRLAPIRAEIVRLMNDPAEIDRIIADGSKRARAIAGPIFAEVKDVVGFVRS
jgi:tryptophanyl-tRNA synthetase